MKAFIEMSSQLRVTSYSDMTGGNLFRFLRQFHEDRVGKEMKVQEYILGKFNKQKFEDDKKEEERDRKNDITRHPPTKVTSISQSKSFHP